MSPIKSEFLLKKALGQEIISVGDFIISLNTGILKGKVPEELKGHVKNIIRHVNKRTGTLKEALKKEPKWKKKKRSLGK
jgi:hypothetical protein